MHVVIINGSPRVEKYSNTEKIIDAFAEGLAKAGATFERYAISDRKNWDMARESYTQNAEIIFALPLYVENIPGLLLEFFETLPIKDNNTRVSFILQGGFSEASQLECGKKFLEKLPKYLNVSYGGTLIKGDNFGIRVVSKEDALKITGPYQEMGKSFVENNGFKAEIVKKFAGPDYLPVPMRIMIQIIFKTIARKKFETVSKEWGANVPIDYRPWQ